MTTQTVTNTQVSLITQDRAKHPDNQIFDCYAIFKRVVRFLPIDDLGAISFLRLTHYRLDDPFVSLINKHFREQILTRITKYDGKDYDDQYTFMKSVDRYLLADKNRYLLADKISEINFSILIKYRTVRRALNSHLADTWFHNFSQTNVKIAKMLARLRHEEWLHVRHILLLEESPKDIPLLQNPLLLEKTIEKWVELKNEEAGLESQNPPRLQILLPNQNPISHVLPHAELEYSENLTHEEVKELVAVRKNLVSVSPNIELCQSHNICLITPPDHAGPNLQSKIDSTLKRYRDFYSFGRREISEFAGLAIGIGIAVIGTKIALASRNITIEPRSEGFVSALFFIFSTSIMNEVTGRIQEHYRNLENDLR